MTVSRSRPIFPPHRDLFIGNASLNSCGSLKILGVMFDSKFTFERHILSILLSIAQKIGLLRKSFGVFGDQDVLLRCFNSFILPCLEYCSLFGVLQKILIVNYSSISVYSLSFSPMRFNTSQYFKCFIQATTRLWNDLPSMIIEAAELQEFKHGANAF